MKQREKGRDMERERERERERAAARIGGIVSLVWHNRNFVATSETLGASRTPVLTFAAHRTLENSISFLQHATRTREPAHEELW